MNILLNGTEVKRELFTINSGLNYGRFFDQEAENYEVKIPTSEFLSLIEAEYNKARDEIKEDDQAYDDTSEFTHTNYCSLSELFTHEADFEEVMKTYLDKTLLEKLFSDSELNQYVINSTDSIRISDTNVSIKGRVFKLS